MGQDSKPKKKYQHIPPAAVIKFRAEGYTLQEIGEFYGVTKQRIFQVLGGNPKKSPEWIKQWRERRRERNRIVEVD